MAALLILVGAMAMITTLTGWDIGAVGFLGVALLVVGIGLVAAAFAPGRTARGGLIALGVVLSLGLMVAASEPLDDVSSEIGDRTYRPATAAVVQPVYRGDVGDLTLDLSLVDVGADGPIRTRIANGLGDLQVVLPRDADVQVDVETGLGTVDVLGQGDTDGDFPGRGTGSWVGDGVPDIYLVITNDLGDVEVSRG